MSTQVVFYAVLALVIVALIWRSLRMRSIPQYSPAEVEERLQQHTDIVLLDVRTGNERTAGAIKGSLHIPLQSLHARMEELNKYKNREIVCYCQTGSRSVRAAMILRKHGFQAANMRGGMSEWRFVHR